MTMPCRHCATPLTLDFLDLGSAPPSNAYLTAEDLDKPEAVYPLRLKVCPSCRLVQTEDYTAAGDLFTPDYAYFSSTSRSWLDHARRYCEMITRRLQLGSESHVIEVASNDGYLLRNFVAAGIPCLGIEPTSSTATAARALGIEVLEEFFGEDLARRIGPADLIIGNNVYAHVPDINDFTRGLCAALKPEGVVTLEFPHLMRLVEFGQFDTVYHEHFSYLSLMAVERVMAAAGLRVFDVEELPTHGGSLRVYACRSGAQHAEAPAVAAMRAEEHRRGMAEDAFYAGFQARADAVRDAFTGFLREARQQGRSVAAYGAAAKGNTLINFAGVGPDLLPFVCDAAEAKIGRFLPGSHIPILHPDELRRRRPDDLIILPWNIAEEIVGQCADLAAQRTRFVTFVPDFRVHG
jgi:SAM-dependent methyltransferase